MDPLSRKVLTALLVTAAVLSAGMAVYAYSIDPVTVEETSEKVIEFRGSLKHHADFSNESIYGDSASLSVYPRKITDKIYGNYKLTTSPESEGEYLLSVDASYYIQNGREKTLVWKENILSESGQFSGTRLLNFTLTPASLQEDLKRVKEGTGFSRVIQSVVITVKADVKGESFVHTIPFVSGSDTFAFKDTEKSDTVTRNVRTVEENSVTGLDVGNARLLYATLAISALIPAAVINRHQISDLRSGRSESKSYIIEGKQEGEKVVLNSFEDLKKVFQLSESPVIKTEGEDGTAYTITHEGILYEFRKRS